jgi:hypothetical protein
MDYEELIRVYATHFQRAACILFVLFREQGIYIQAVLKIHFNWPTFDT